MKTSLSHLPEDKKSQVLKLKDLIIKKVPNADKIILFGSYATGNWVEDRYTEKGIRYEYVSDLDVLIVTPTKNEKEYVLQDKIVNSWRYHTPVNPIVHTIDYVNEGLENGQYFFTDIIRHGILLFNANNSTFSDPKSLSSIEIRTIAGRYFKQWFENGNEFLIDAKNAKERKNFNRSAFYLHQATENFYSAALLVFSGYKPKTHNLNTLRDYLKPYSKELYTVFSPLPSNDRENKLFSMLQRGYIEARYNESFKVNQEDLEVLFERVIAISNIVENICKARIESIH